MVDQSWSYLVQLERVRTLMKIARDKAYLVYVVRRVAEARAAFHLEKAKVRTRTCRREALEEGVAAFCEFRTDDS